MLEDGAFLGALAAVSAARGGELLLDLIVSDDAAAAGAYTFQFFKHGTWQQVAVDNYLPCLADQVGEGRAGCGLRSLKSRRDTERNLLRIRHAHH